MVMVDEMLYKHAKAALIIELDVVEAINMAAYGNHSTFCGVQLAYDLISHSVNVIALSVEYYPVEGGEVNKIEKFKLIVAVLCILVSDFTEKVEVVQIKSELFCCYKGCPRSSETIENNISGTRRSLDDTFKHINILRAEEPIEGFEDVIDAARTATKIIRNGQLLIIRDGKVYTVQGVEVR